MTCRELTEFMMAYEDGELPAHQRAAFERHLAVCPTCVAFLECYRRTTALTRALRDRPDAPLPAQVPEALVSAILEARRHTRA